MAETCIKGLWTKLEGRRIEAGSWGGGEWWERNADNCTLTTIKEKMKSPGQYRSVD